MESGTYQCEGITQQNKPRRMFRQLIRQLTHIAIHLAIRLAYLEGFLVDFVYRFCTRQSASRVCVLIVSPWFVEGRTYHGLRILCTTRSETEFAELSLGVGGDGVEACFGGL
jgi:hypothetical protein